MKEISSDEKEKLRKRGRNNKAKGASFERTGCEYFRSVGFTADRTAPMQAKTKGQDQSKDYPDVIVYDAWLDGSDFLVECKNWKQFTARKLWDWLEETGAHAVLFKLPRKKPLIAIDPEVFAKLLGEYHENSR